VHVLDAWSVLFGPGCLRARRSARMAPRRDDPAIFAINLMNEPRCECHPTHIPLPANYSVLPSCQARPIPAPHSMCCMTSHAVWALAPWA